MFNIRTKTPPPRIEVLFQNTPVAELSYDKSGKYVFEYLPAFQELKLARLPGLPFGKKHEAQDLFPFFQERIPELCRPEIKEWLRQNAVREDDKMELLRTLGKRSVTDSFELRPKIAA